MPWSVPLTSNKRSPITKQEYNCKYTLSVWLPPVSLDRIEIAIEYALISVKRRLNSVVNVLASQE